MFTGTHHRLIEQFLEYKARTYHILKERDYFLDRIQTLEYSLAIKSPVLEAEYAIDERTSLSLYDCLVPKIKEHRRFRI